MFLWIVLVQLVWFVMGTLLRAAVLCCVSGFRRWTRTVLLVKWLAMGWMNWGWILEGARGFSLLQNVQTSSGAHTALYRVCTTVLSSGSSGPGMKVTISLHLVPKAIVRGAVPPFLPYVNVVWTETTVTLCLKFRNVTAALNKDWLQFYVLQASNDENFKIFWCRLYSVTFQ